MSNLREAAAPAARPAAAAESADEEEKAPGELPRAPVVDTIEGVRNSFNLIRLLSGSAGNGIADDTKQIALRNQLVQKAV